MAKYSASYTSLTHGTGQGDGASLTSATYLAVLGVASARLSLYEVYMGGEAASTSSPIVMVLGRSSAIATGSLSGGRLALLDATGLAPSTAPTAFTAAATTGPQRSSTLHLLHLSFNAYGGIVRWVEAPGSEIQMFGATATAGESSLSAFTGSTSAATSGHILLEAL